MMLILFPLHIHSAEGLDKLFFMSMLNYSAQTISNIDSITLFKKYDENRPYHEIGRLSFKIVNWY